MKILMVNKFLYPRGGAESYMLKIAENLKSKGHEVEFFGMYDAKNTVGNSLGLYTENMDFHSTAAKRFMYPFKIIWSREAATKIGRVIDSFCPDVVHMNNINFQLTPSIIDTIKQKGIPLIQTVHDYQMICPNHLLYDFNSECVCERCVGKNKFHCIKHKCIHGSRVKSILGTIEYYFYSIKGTYKKVDRYICPSRFLESRLIKNKPQLYTGRTTVIHNYIEKNLPDEIPKSKFDFPYIVFAGRLSAEKGIKILAQVARILPDVQFVVMGDGEEKALLTGLDNVTLTGFVTGQELISNIAGAELITVPSVCYENCPLSILEAQILGVPAVTMNMGGMAELVVDGVTGFLSASHSPEDFAAAIRKALSDKEKLMQMKANCLTEAEKSISIDDYCNKIIDIYEGILCRK